MKVVTSHGGDGSKPVSPIETRGRGV
jgi:hypothetical protein